MRYRKAGGGHIVGPAHAGAHTGAPLHRRPKLRIVRFRVNAKAHSLRWASFSPRRPLRWVAVGAPTSVTGSVFRRRGTDGGPAGQTGTARRLSRFAGQSRCVPPKARQRLSRNRRENGRRCAPGFCPVCTARRRHEPPFWGAGGGTPAPSFPPFLREEMGAPSSAQARFRAGPKAHSLRWASSPHDDHSVGSPRGPHWARPARGQPLWAGDHRSLLRTARRVVAPHGASGCGGKRADDIRPYRVGQLPARRAGAPREGAPRCGNGGNPSSGPAGRLPPGGGVTCSGGKPPPYWLAMRSARSLRYTQRSIFCSRAASSSACLACNSWRAT